MERIPQGEYERGLPPPPMKMFEKQFIKMQFGAIFSANIVYIFG